jgi:sugar lactone lactonase YvrE
LLRLEPDGLVEVADLGQLASFHCNDMVVDQEGRAYIGNFGFDPSAPSTARRPAEIILVEPDGSARVAADQLVFPNGAIITPDGQTFVVAETYAARLTAFDIEPEGALTRRRVWAQFDPEEILPDGICLDAEGAIWVASPRGCAEVRRVLEGGKVTHRVRVMTQPIAVMLGGPDRRTLFVCTSQFGKRLPGTGRIETVRVEVPGAGLP